MDLDGLRAEVERWFEPASLAEVLGAVDGPADQVARQWLGRAGKRWRPFLAACAYQATRSDSDGPFPHALRQVAVAVECFHKASLIHDDIEDGDVSRYGSDTLHVEHGLSVALNAGDLLIGEGYRLLGSCDVPPDVRASMMQIAAQGHRQLCVGQGAELAWTKDPRPLTSADVIDIFRRKTSPAFEVALRVGAALGGASEDVHRTLRRYSDALGIAYQIRDDLEDLTAERAPDAGGALRPTLPLAIAHERASGAAKAALQRAWHRSRSGFDDPEIARLITELGAAERCRTLVEMYKEQAIRSLPELQSASLKGLLRRVIGKIFRLEVQGWCSEFETRNAAGRPSGAAAIG
jgi:geranylgeranyl diphosphate synthase type II